MSELATELELNWIETDDGWDHVSGEVVIMAETYGYGLYVVDQGLLVLVKLGELHTVVDHFLYATF